MLNDALFLFAYIITFAASVNGPSSPRDPIYRADTLSPPVSAIIRATPSPPLSVTSSAFLPPPRSSTPPPIRLQHAKTEQDMTGSPSSSAFDVSSIAFEREDIPVAPGDSSADTSMSAQSTAPGHGDNGRHAEEDDELDGRVLAAIEQELTKSTRRAPLATSTPARAAAPRAANDVKSPANATVATARGLAAPTPRRPASLARSSNGTSRPPSAAPRPAVEDDYRRPTPEFMLTASAAVPPTTSPTLGLSVDGNGSGNGSGSGNDTDMTGSHYSQPASATVSASGSMPPPQSASQRILDAIRTTRLAPPSGPMSPISATASLSSDGTLARGSDSGSVRNKGRVGAGSAQLVPGSTSTRRVASDGSERGQARSQALETEVESSPWTIGVNGRRAVSGQAASRPVSTGEFGETLRYVCFVDEMRLVKLMIASSLCQAFPIGIDLSTSPLCASCSPVVRTADCRSLVGLLDLSIQSRLEPRYTPQHRLAPFFIRCTWVVASRGQHRRSHRTSPLWHHAARQRRLAVPSIHRIVVYFHAQYLGEQHALARARC